MNSKNFLSICIMCQKPVDQLFPVRCHHHETCVTPIAHIDIVKIKSMTKSVFTIDLSDLLGVVLHVYRPLATKTRYLITI